MIYTVTFNPALDYTIKLERLSAGAVNRSLGEEISFGGKGINVSSVLTKLGVENTALGFRAGFTGNKLVELMRKDGINADFIELEHGSTRINVKLRAGEELDINASGPEIGERYIEKLYEKLSVFSSKDTVVLAGSVPPSVPETIYEKIAEIAENCSARLVADTTGNYLLNLLKFKPFLIKPNHYELAELFGTELCGEADIIKHARILQEKGAVNVLVSRGKQGALLLDETGCVSSIGIIDKPMIKSVGCGDSMVAGFLAGYLEKNDYLYALLLGAACANASAFSSGLAEREEIEAAMLQLKNQIKRL